MKRTLSLPCLWQLCVHESFRKVKQCSPFFVRGVAVRCQVCVVRLGTNKTNPKYGPAQMLYAVSGSGFLGWSGLSTRQAAAASLPSPHATVDPGPDPAGITS